MASPVDLVVVGSIGLDTIETRDARREDILGGSVTYACAAASFLTSVGMVGVVGSDFPAENLARYQRFGIDRDGLQTREGATFRWSGVYDENMIDRRTLSTELGVFADFMPELPPAYRQAPFLLLGNIGPELQLHVLDEAENARFVAADTMNLWIDIARDALMEVVKRSHLLTLNDEEARMLTGKYHLRDCADAILALGPQYVVIKKGEHGAMLFSADDIFLAPAFPVQAVADPTGAGDTYAGGFMGSLARDGEVTGEGLRNALITGAVIASFGVEAFSLERLETLTREEISHRREALLAMVRVPA